MNRRNIGQFCFLLGSNNILKRRINFDNWLNESLVTTLSRQKKYYIHSICIKAKDSRA